MERSNNQETILPPISFQEKARKIFALAMRWFFMTALLSAALFSVFVWYRYIWKADWSEERKQQYIREQAKFTFDKKNYLKMIDYLENRKEKLSNFPKYEGRDLFFPDGY